ncbi:hypothetical protein GCM10009737_10870 [Nocardioides lentus]|uniref:Uncharacterized protein n=1 Tax=Nocardioides lentus TaxID=338077 RepID=A0ABN2P3R3_9ACTN
MTDEHQTSDNLDQQLRRLQSDREAAEQNELAVAREAVRLAIASNCGYERPELEALHLGWQALNREAVAVAEEADEAWDAWAVRQKERTEPA